MIDNLLDSTASAISEGQKSERKGYYHFASLKYSQATGMLQIIVQILDSGQLSASEKEKARLSVLLELVAVRLDYLQSKMGNGKHRMSGIMGPKDSPSEAISKFSREFFENL